MIETQPAASVPQPGWYADVTGHLRWWDGSAWGPYAPPQQMQQVQYAGRTANKMPVSYNRQQTGHSLSKHLLFGWMLLYIPTIYFMVSPNHYFRA